MDFVDIPIGRDEKPKRESRAKYPNSKKVFSLWGKYPRNWEMNSTQCRAAENLFSERGIEEIENALKWYAKVREKEFCPRIDTPYDLDSKWAKLETFVEKL